MAKFKKLTKTEKVLLSMSDRSKYDTYRCEEHGIYQVRKDIPEETRGYAYCKKKHTKLTDEEIQTLLK